MHPYVHILSAYQPLLDVVLIQSGLTFLFVCPPGILSKCLFRYETTASPPCVLLTIIQSHCFELLFYQAKHMVVEHLNENFISKSSV